jgi:hypothetical protein
LTYSIRLFDGDLLVRLPDSFQSLTGTSSLLILLLAILATSNAARELMQQPSGFTEDDLPSEEEVAEIMQQRPDSPPFYRPWAAAFKNATFLLNRTSSLIGNTTALLENITRLNDTDEAGFLLPPGFNLTAFNDSSLLNVTGLNGTAANLTTSGNLTTINLRCALI